MTQGKPLTLQVQSYSIYIRKLTGMQYLLDYVPEAH